MIFFATRAYGYLEAPVVCDSIRHVELDSVWNHSRKKSFSFTHITKSAIEMIGLFYIFLPKIFEMIIEWRKRFVGVCSLRVERFILALHLHVLFLSLPPSDHTIAWCSDGSCLCLVCIVIVSLTSARRKIYFGGKKVIVRVIGRLIFTVFSMHSIRVNHFYQTVFSFTGSFWCSHKS